MNTYFNILLISGRLFYMYGNIKKYLPNKSIKSIDAEFMLLWSKLHRISEPLDRNTVKQYSEVYEILDRLMVLLHRNNAGLERPPYTFKSTY